MTQKVPNLENAFVGEELNPLAYDLEDYANLDDMIAFIRENGDKEPVKINPADLSVNGTVCAEPMENYLKAGAPKFNPVSGGYDMSGIMVSNSALKEVLKTPKHWWFYMTDRTSKKSKEHFDLGTFAHMAFLEPELFEKVIVEPDCNLTTLDGAQKFIDFWEAHTNFLNKQDARNYAIQEGLDLTKLSGKKAYGNKLKELSRFESVKEEHYAVIKWLKRNYYDYGGGILPHIFKGAVAELSMYGKDESTGLGVKIRPDAINIEENIGVNAIISVKTTAANTKGKFEQDCAAYRYHIGEGMYQKVASDITGRNFNATIMVMLQTQPPYLMAVWWWSPEDLHIGKMQYEKGMQLISDALNKGQFPGFDAHAERDRFGIIEMNLPHWITREAEEEMELEN